MNQRKKDILGGFIILLLSGGLYFWNWYLLFNESRYYPKAMMIGAAMMFAGLGLIIFGGYRTERISKGEDISRLSGLKLLTPKWWCILIVSLLFAFANWIYVEWFFQH